MKRLLALIALSVVGGCVGPWGYGLGVPTERAIENELLVNTSFDQTWRRVTARVSQPPFVEVGADRETGVVIAEFVATPISEFIDCGGLTIWHWRDDFDGPYAEYFARQIDEPIVGVMSITVEPASISTSLVAVEAQYALSVPATWTPAGELSAFAVDVVTGQSAVGPPTPGTMRRECRSTGAAEQLVLDAVRG